MQARRAATMSMQTKPMRAVGVQNFAYCLLFLQLGKSGLRELQLFSVDNIHLIIIARGDCSPLLLIEIRHGLVGLCQHFMVGRGRSARLALELFAVILLLRLIHGVVEVLDRLGRPVWIDGQRREGVIIPLLARQRVDGVVRRGPCPSKKVLPEVINLARR